MPRTRRPHALNVETRAGVLECRRLGESFSYRVDMGAPRLGWDEPFRFGLAAVPIRVASICG